MRARIEKYWDYEKHPMKARFKDKAEAFNLLTKEPIQRGTPTLISGAEYLAQKQGGVSLN